MENSLILRIHPTIPDSHSLRPAPVNLVYYGKNSFSRSLVRNRLPL